MSEITKSEIAADRALVEKATPGELRIGARADGTRWMSIGDARTGPHFQADVCCSDSDAKFLPVARTRWPIYIEEVERLRGILQQWFDYEAFCKEPQIVSSDDYLAEGRRRWFKFREEAMAALHIPSRWRVSLPPELLHYPDPISKDPEADCRAYAGLDSDRRLVQWSDDGGVSWNE